MPSKNYYRPPFCYIYGLVDPLLADQVIRFCGASTNPERMLRDFNYWKPDKAECQAKVIHWCHYLRKTSFSPQIIILEKVSYNDELFWRKRHRYWVAELRRRNHPLLNVGNGGKGFLWVGKKTIAARRFEFTPEICAKLSRSQKASRGHRMSQKHRLMHSRMMTEYHAKRRREIKK